MNKKYMIIGGILAALLGGYAIAYASGDVVANTYIPNAMRRTWWLWPLVAVMAAAITIWAVRFRDDGPGRVKDYGFNYNAYRLSDAWRWISAGIVSVTLIGALFAVSVGDYFADKAYVAETEFTDKPVGDYQERAPYDIAKARATDQKGDLRGAVSTVKYGTDDRWSVVVGSVNAFSGYQGVVEYGISPDGTPVETERCSAPNSRAVGSWFGASLRRAAAKEEAGLIIREDDVTGFCRDGHAVIVAPATKLVGWFALREKPAGVIVMDTKTGNVDYDADAKSSEYNNVQVYPTSLAARQREALAAYEASYIQWLFGKAGYEAAISEKRDPNSDNPSEVALNGDHGLVATTQLAIRGKGASSRTAANAEVNTDSVKAGELSKMRVHKVDVENRRPRNLEIVDDIKSSFSTDIPWATKPEVFEIVPTSATQWRATIGFKRNVSFVVYVNADGTSELADTNGRKLGSYDPNSKAETPAPSSGTVTGNLTDMADKELAALLAQVSSEVSRRAAN